MAGTLDILLIFTRAMQEVPLSVEGIRPQALQHVICSVGTNEADEVIYKELLIVI